MGHSAPSDKLKDLVFQRQLISMGSTRFFATLRSAQNDNMKYRYLADQPA
jgi:hypothetical protein